MLSHDWYKLVVQKVSREVSNAYIEWMEEAGISSIEKKTSDAMSQKMSVGLFAAVHPPPPSDFSVKQAWCKMSSLQN